MINNLFNNIKNNNQDETKIEIFDFEKDWNLVEPHLDDPKLLKLLNKAMRRFSTENFRPPTTSLPPMYTWPAPLKRIILVLASSACLGAYLLLIGGLLGIVLLWVQFTWR